MSPRAALGGSGSSIARASTSSRHIIRSRLRPSRRTRRWRFAGVRRPTPSVETGSPLLGFRPRRCAVPYPWAVGSAGSRRGGHARFHPRSALSPPSTHRSPSSSRSGTISIILGPSRRHSHTVRARAARGWWRSPTPSSPGYGEPGKGVVGHQCGRSGSALHRASHSTNLSWVHHPRGCRSHRASLLSYSRNYARRAVPRLSISFNFRTT